MSNKQATDKMVRTSFYVNESVLKAAKEIGKPRDRSLTYMVRYFLKKGLDAEMAEIKQTV